MTLIEFASCLEPAVQQPAVQQPAGLSLVPARTDEEIDRLIDAVRDFDDSVPDPDPVEAENS